MTQQKKTNNILLNLDNRLSVQVTLTGLSFLVTNSFTKKTVFFIEEVFDAPPTPEELLLTIERVFYETPSLQGKFKEVSIIYATNLYTLVPQTLFDDTKTSEYLKFNSKMLSNDVVVHDVVENHGIVVVYVPYMNINNYLFDRYGTFQYYHSMSVLLKAFLSTEKYSREPKVFIHVLEDAFDLIILTNGELTLGNTYSYKTPEDFIYYVLFSLEQLKINPDTVRIQLCGAILENDSRYQALYQYVRNVSFCHSIALQLNEIEGSASHEKFVLKNTL